MHAVAVLKYFVLCGADNCPGSRYEMCIENFLNDFNKFSFEENMSMKIILDKNWKTSTKVFFRNSSSVLSGT
jgi:hypothetical protein